MAGKGGGEGVVALAISAHTNIVHPCVGSGGCGGDGGRGSAERQGSVPGQPAGP